MIIRLIKLIIYLIIIQIEMLFNIFIFIFIYIYNKLIKLILKEESNFDKFKKYLNNNKLNITYNLLFLILNPSNIYFSILCICTIIGLPFRSDESAIFNFIALLSRLILLE